MPACIVGHFQVPDLGGEGCVTGGRVSRKGRAIGGRGEAGERSPARRAQFKSLERSYLRLAIQADKNAGTNIVYETPPERPAAQQQQQSKKKSEY